MPSPFPGMDPYIENQAWEDFHHRLIVVMADPLIARLRPRYVVKVEERVYIERELFLTIRERETQEIITVIELLSPGNKRPGSDGRREYLQKRDAVLRTSAHLIELDLLRGGERLPTLEPLPPADFYAFVCRRQDRPLAEVYAWTLRQPLPAIPVPLAGDDPDSPLDLQAVFATVYDRAGYDYALDYRRPVEPPLAAADVAWATDVMHARE